MLQVKGLKKNYGDSSDLSNYVRALKGIDLNFRDSEFVSILGPSGCGKTTFLNIIGGLDNYTKGDIIINGISTKDYKDRDWDTYRNHSVGFVFQSYNLINHLTILENVELALTLAGMSKKERKRKAKEALKTVGLGDKVKKRPTELSGGQMQRVAIARALVSDPEILLADEPTGALDQETSNQIMKLLKKVSKDRLVIMVTHNEEIANNYSTRIVNLLDGEVTNDSNPFEPTDDEIEKSKNHKVDTKKTFMNLRTALSLSFRNLMTKKGRTTLTAFAGSIGIIGIALIMSLSNGIQTYINSVEEDTLASYPITIEEESIDLSSMMEAMMGEEYNNVENKDKNTIYSSNLMDDMLTTFSEKSNSNNLELFRKYIEKDNSKIKELSNDIQYDYNIKLNIYRNDTKNIVRVNPSTVMDSIGMGSMMDSMNENDAAGIMNSLPMGQAMSNTDIFIKLYNNKKMLETQYNLVAGTWPKNYNEVVIMADKDGFVSDYTLYTLGLKDQKVLTDRWNQLLDGKELKKEKIDKYKYEDLLKLEFKLILNSDYYEKDNGIWKDKSNDNNFLKDKIKNGLTLKVVGIVLQDEESISNSSYGNIGYLSELEEYVINKNNNSKVVKEQKDKKDTNILTGLKFTDNDEFDINSLSSEQLYQLSIMSKEELTEMMKIYQDNNSATLESNLKKMGSVDLNVPSKINIYPKDFESKEAISDEITNYNNIQEKDGKDENVINYVDIVGVMISSVTKIVNIISYVLIAFVSISLIVSSIMIAIITYISVLERTKEIGILRSIGASKKDVGRVFNAETIIEGLFAGIMGIIITLIISIPVNIICNAKLGVKTICLLPIGGAIGLVVLSVILTLIAGLIPSRLASKQDPAIALRSE